MKKLTALALAVLTLAVSGGAMAATITPVLTGLDNPRGLAFGPDGALYVVEAGRGGSGPCVPLMGQNRCVGLSGAITRLARLGHSERVVTGLPSLAPASGDEAAGPYDISFQGGSAYVTIGLQANPVVRSMLGQFGRFFGHVVRLTPSGGAVDVADVAAHEAALNPGGGPVDSNPAGILADQAGQLVVDAGGNTLLRVGAGGAITTVAVFPSRAQGRSTDSVPTAVVAGPDGAYYVSELSGAPFLPNAARIYRVVPGQQPTIFADNLTDVTDLAFDASGNLFVLEFSTCGPFFCGPGAVIRIAPSGARTMVAGGLPAASGLLLGPSGSLLVSVNGASAGTGQVVWIQP